MKGEKYPLTGGEKGLNLDGYRLIRRESVAPSHLCGGKAASYRPFRITGQGVFVNGEVKVVTLEP